MRSHQVFVSKVNRIQENQIDATLQQMWKNATAGAQKAIQSDWTTTSKSLEVNPNEAENKQRTLKPISQTLIVAQTATKKLEQHCEQAAHP